MLCWVTVGAGEQHSQQRCLVGSYDPVSRIWNKIWKLFLLETPNIPQCAESEIWISHELPWHSSCESCQVRLKYYGESNAANFAAMCPRVLSSFLLKNMCKSALTVPIRWDHETKCLTGTGMPRMIMCDSWSWSLRRGTESCVASPACIACIGAAKLHFACHRWPWCPREPGKLLISMRESRRRADKLVGTCRNYDNSVNPTFPAGQLSAWTLDVYVPRASIEIGTALSISKRTWQLSGPFWINFRATCQAIRDWDSHNQFEPLDW